jgi:hypothetical protein
VKHGAWLRFGRQAHIGTKFRMVAKGAFILSFENHHHQRGRHMLLKVRQGCDFTQDGKTYRSGDLVDVPEKYVVVLTVPGGRLEKPDAPDEGAGQLQHTAVTVGDQDRAPLADAGQTPANGRRRYNRRDMQAKD